MKEIVTCLKCALQSKDAFYFQLKPYCRWCVQYEVEAENCYEASWVLAELEPLTTPWYIQFDHEKKRFYAIKSTIDGHFTLHKIVADLRNGFGLRNLGQYRKDFCANRMSLKYGKRNSKEYQEAFNAFYERLV